MRSFNFYSEPHIYLYFRILTGNIEKKNTQKTTRIAKKALTLIIKKKIIILEILRHNFLGYALKSSGATMVSPVEGGLSSDPC